MLANWGKISRSAYVADEDWSSWTAITRSQFAQLVEDAPEVLPARRAPVASNADGRPMASTLVVVFLAVVAISFAWASERQAPTGEAAAPGAAPPVAPARP